MPSANDQPLPGARVALILLLLINFFNYVDRQVLAAVEVKIEETFFPESDYPRNDPDNPEHRAQKARIESLMGSLTSAFMVSYMLIAPLFGFLADRVSRWLLIAIGVVFWSLASGASGLAATFGILFLTRCLVGVGEAAYGPVAPTVIADLYPVSKRGSKLAWFYVAIPVGSAFGYILGGMVANIMNDWRWAFYVVVPPGIALGIWCLFMKEPQKSDARVTPKATWNDYLSLLKIPSYVFNTLGMTCMTFAMGGIGFWMPRYLYKERGVGELAEVNFMFGIILVTAGLAATLLGGWLGDRLKTRFSGSYFLVSALGMFLGFPTILGVLYGPESLIWVFIFLACFWLFFNTGPTNTVLANVTKPSIRATGFAVNILVIHALGDAVSPAILGYINGSFGMNTGFLVVSCMFLAAGVFWLLGMPHLQRDTERAEGLSQSA